MNLKQELQQLNDKLDKFRRKLDAAEKRGDQGLFYNLSRKLRRLLSVLPM